MNMGLISLIVLIVAIFVGFKKGANTGLVSIAFAFVLGFFVLVNVSKDPAAVKLLSLSAPAAKGKAIVGGFNTSLFFILMGMTFLFSIAKVNGTLELAAKKAAALAKGNLKLLPWLFFVLTAFLAAVGPGNIAIPALILPIAMVLAFDEGIPSLMMAGMVIAGANAGGLSPIAPTGLIHVGLAEKIGFDTGMHVFMNMAIAHVCLALFIFIVLGGLKLPSKAAAGTVAVKPEPFNSVHRLTIIVIALVVVGIVFFKLHIGLTAFLGGVILILLNAAKDKEAIAAMPWPTLLLVTGVGVLVNVVNIAGGIDYLCDMLSQLMSTTTAAPIMCILGGLMSSVSSASGVVLPTLIPTVPGLVESMGGAVTGESLITGIVLGAHVVTASPLSTLGALAMASMHSDDNPEKLFRNLLILGFGSILFGAVLMLVGIVR